MNSLAFAGNLGRDAELRFTKGDSTPVLGFSVAMTSGFGDRETTTWVNCTLWGARGEKLADYLKKGSMVFIIGEASLREYQKRDGGKGYSMECRVNDIKLAPRGGDQPAPAPASTASDYRAARDGSAPQAPQQQDSFDDDIPF